MNNSKPAQVGKFYLIFKHGLHYETATQSHKRKTKSIVFIDLST